MRKFLLISLAVLLVLLVVGWLALDSAIAAAVEKGGTYALGVDTKLGSASVSPIGGKLGLARLDVANAKGFEAPFFLRVAHTAVEVTPASLMQDTVEVPSFLLDDLEVYLERTTKGTNYDAILDSLKRFESSESKAPPGEPGEGSSKKFIVRDVLIRNVVVHANVAPGVLGKSGHFSVTIPEIHLTNVGTGKGGQSVAALMSELVKAVLAAAVKSGAGVFPDGMLEGLGGELSALGNSLGSELGKLGENAGSAFDHLTKKVFK